jgi:S-DNA-T family DNA segregation ATPase FtsK/SpoIIIE
MELRYRLLDAARRRKILPLDDLDLIVCVIDELAYYTATTGTKEEQELFRSLVRDLVARGRAAGIIVVAATQRPSADIVPTSLRDLFGFRVAFRCTTDSSSDIILSVGWASEGFTAKSIRPEDIGIGFILAEGGTPRRFKAAYLTDPQIRGIVAAARHIREQHGPAA